MVILRLIAGYDPQVGYIPHIIGFVTGLSFGIAWSTNWKKNLLTTMVLLGIYITILTIAARFLSIAPRTPGHLLCYARLTVSPSPTLKFSKNQPVLFFVLLRLFSDLALFSVLLNGEQGHHLQTH